MDRVTKIVVRGDVSDAVAKVRLLGSSVGVATKAMAGSSREAGVYRQNLSAVGDSAGRMGLAVSLGLGLAVRAFANFDEAISHVAATGADARASIDGLRAAALDAGQRTTYSATEAANAIEELAKAGVSAKDILGGALDGALNLAAAGGLGVADAASIAATTLNQFSLQGTDAAHVADLLSGAANAAQGSVADVGEALKYVGPVAAQMGVSLEETTGTIAELASQGILADQAGTSLRGMLTSLTSPSKIAGDTMAQLGIKVYDAQGQFVGFKGIASELKTTMSGLSESERDQALGRIFGNEQITAARILYKGGAEDVAKWTDAINISGGAAETARVRMDNLKGDIEQLGGALETAFIGSANGSDGPLRQLTQDLTGLVNAYNKLPAPLQSAAFGLAAVTAALGVGLFAASKSLAAYVSMRASLTALGVTSATAAKSLRVLGVAAAAFAAVDIGAAIGDSFDKRNSDDIDKMSASLENLVKTGKATGDLAGLFGDDLHGKTVRFGKDLGGIGESIKSLQGYADDSSLTEAFKFFGSGGQSAGIVAQAEAVQDLDKALSSLSEDDPNGAIAAFSKVRDEALKTGASAKDVAAAFPTMTQALQASAQEAGRASDATSVLTGDLQQLAPVSKEAAQAQKDLDDANRKTANAFLDISQGIDDSKVSLVDWIKQMADQADALTAFGDNVQKAAKRGLEDGLIASLQDAGPAGAMRLKQLADASDTELERANKAWRKAQRASEDYIKTFGEVPGIVETVVRTPGAKAAKDAVEALQKALDSINPFKTVTIKTVGSSPGGTGPTRNADGGAIAGPGTATSDSIPALLSNGEHVWTAAEVQAAGGQDAMYRMRAMVMSGVTPKFADGGAVGVTPLDIKRQQASVRDIERSLRETETVGKGKNKRRRKVLRGLDRQIAELELRDARQELADLRSNREAREAAADEILNRRTTAKTEALSKFSIGSSSSAAAVDRNLANLLADSATFLGLLGDLKAKGASPWLLAQLVEAGPTKGAIRLARQYSTDQAALDSINARSAQIEQYSNAYASLVGNAAFSQAGAWNSGVSSASVAPMVSGAQVQIDVHPAQGLSESAIAHQVAGQLMWRMN